MTKPRVHDIIVHNEQGVLPFPTDRWTVVSGNKVLRNRCVGDSRMLPGREGLRTVRSGSLNENPVGPFRVANRLLRCTN